MPDIDTGVHFIDYYTNGSWGFVRGGAGTIVQMGGGIASTVADPLSIPEGMYEQLQESHAFASTHSESTGGYLIQFGLDATEIYGLADGWEGKDIDGNPLTQEEREEGWAKGTIGVLGVVGAAGGTALGLRNCLIRAPGSSVPKGYTRVYRAVSEEEYRDILSTGVLRQGPNSLEGKWFADSLEGANAHGRSLFPNGRFRLIEVDVPDNAPSLFKSPNLDGLGPARYLHIDDLLPVRPRPLE
jgi:hypothetical protein